MQSINWLEWGEEPFRIAHELDKPILLSIGASWCHWCHVMDRTTYSDPRVCELVNAEFVAIRVDNDRQPDVNDRYNMGGWPTTCFLTPSGDIISGGTYIPPDAMLEVLQRVLHYYRLNRGAVHAQAELLRLRSIQEACAPPSPEALLTPALLNEVLGLVLDAFDPRFGGFGTGQKFPCFDASEFLLSMYLNSKNRLLLETAEHTLSAQYAGDLHDAEEGGFFRYCTRRDWSSPHFEKMLDDQAGHIKTYSLFGMVSGDTWPVDVARQTLSYVHRYLGDPGTGAFFGSQDADELYYAKTAAQRRTTSPPRVDQTIYTDWNARMVSALVSLWAAGGEPEHLSAACTCLNWLLANCRSPEGLMFHWHDGKPHLPNHLRDAATVIAAALDVYEATGDGTYLSAAGELADASRAVLLDPERGGFWDCPLDANAPGRLSYPQKPIVHNALIAHSLIRLYCLTEDTAYRRDAERALRWFASRFQQWGHLSAGYGLAVLAAVVDPVVVRIVGPRHHPTTSAMLYTAVRHPFACKAVRLLDPERDGAVLDKLSLSAQHTPAAYCCIGSKCLPPVFTPDDLKMALARA
ncbi:MAG: thioredoxin domain-containing protein [Armatimonadota bacterium]